MKLSLKMDKRGIELAANFIIILIISIVVFGLATGLTYKIFCASNTKLDSLNAESERRVEQLLTSSAAFTIADSSKSAKSVASFCAGSSKPAASYLIGIRNDGLDTRTFSIACEYDGMQIGDGLPRAVAGQDCDTPWDVQYPQAITLAGRAKDTKLLIINAPPEVENGKHVFTLRASYVDEEGVTQQYGVKKFTLDIS